MSPDIPHPSDSQAIDKHHRNLFAAILYRSIMDLFTCKANSREYIDAHMFFYSKEEVSPDNTFTFHEICEVLNINSSTFRACIGEKKKEGKDFRHLGYRKIKS